MKTVVITCCTLRDLETWCVSSKYIRRFIEAHRYVTAVPDADKHIFEQENRANFEILNDSSILNVGEFETIDNSEVSFERKGWYTQQLIKLKLTKQYSELGYDVVIWDADTVPLQKIKFFDGDKINLFASKEFHPPYFKTIEKLLGLRKINKKSFIAQSIAITHEIAIDFYNYIEEKHDNNWLTAIIHSIDFDQDNAFSEYETLGTFMLDRHGERVFINDKLWIRSGKKLFASAKHAEKYFFILKFFKCYHITFEHWQTEALWGKLKSSLFKK